MRGVIIVVPTAEQKRRARLALLTFFEKGGETIAALPGKLEVEGMTDDELQDAARALVTVGYLRRVRGRKRGVVYSITPDGCAALKAMKEMEDN